MLRPGPRDWKANALECVGQILHQRDRSLSISHALSSNISISVSVSQAVRSAFPPRPSVASHPTRGLSSGSDNHSHRRIRVGRSETERSFVTFIGVGKNIVVQTCCGHLPHCSTFSRNFTNIPSFLPASDEELMDGTHHIPLPWGPCNFSLPSLISLLSDLAALLPNCFSMLSLLRSALFCRHGLFGNLDTVGRGPYSGLLNRVEENRKRRETIFDVMAGLATAPAGTQSVLETEEDDEMSNVCHVANDPEARR